MNTQGGRTIEEHGASLFYSIGYRGEVIIWMQYPSIDDILWKENDSKEIRTVAQEDITEETIKDDVQDFLQQVIFWNKGEIGKERIGFKASGE